MLLFNSVWTVRSVGNVNGGSSAMPSSAGPNILAEALENASRLIDRHLQDDRCFPDLSELLSVPSHSELCGAIEQKIET